MVNYTLEQFLTEFYPTKGKMWCIKQLKIPEWKVRRKAEDLGLRVNQKSEFYKEWQDRAARTKIGQKRPEQVKVMRHLIKIGKIQPSNNPFKSVKAWRTINKQRCFFKSKWEANAARLLTLQKRKWQYEPKTFWFEKILRGVRSYKPDFFLPKENLWIEVKGFLDKKSATKLKRLKKYYPEIKLEIWDKDFFQALRKQGAPKLIKDWEF